MVDVIDPGPFVHKSRAALPRAFTSPPGSLRRIVEGRPQVLFRPTPPAPVRGGPVRIGVRAVVVGAPFPDGRLLEATARCDGVVLEATGGKHVAVTTTGVPGRLIQPTSVVQPLRKGSGPVLHRTSGLAGFGRESLQAGLVEPGHLDARHSRLIESPAPCEVQPRRDPERGRAVVCLMPPLLRS